MRAFVCSSACAWLGMAAWVAVEESQYWTNESGELQASLSDVLEEYDLLWSVLLLVVVPMLATWASMEIIRAWRRPKLFDRRASPSVWVRAALAAAAGIAGVALFGAATAFAAETHAPDLVNALLSAAIPAIAMGLLLPRIKPGCCIVCNYDTRHLPFPQTPGVRRCPECGAEVA